MKRFLIGLAIAAIPFGSVLANTDISASSHYFQQVDVTVTNPSTHKTKRYTLEVDAGASFYTDVKKVHYVNEEDYNPKTHQVIIHESVIDNGPVMMMRAVSHNGVVEVKYYYSDTDLVDKAKVNNRLLESPTIKTIYESGELMATTTKSGQVTLGKGKGRINLAVKLDTN